MEENKSIDFEGMKISVAHSRTKKYPVPMDASTTKAFKQYLKDRTVVNQVTDSLTVDDIVYSWVLSFATSEEFTAMNEKAKAVKAEQKAQKEREKAEKAKAKAEKAKAKEESKADKIAKLEAELAKLKEEAK